ncbi:related to raffinose invertase [Cephalotrichum gorgonifer]|uniref:beta-fructofuranosidase n=1 Tax=Cephalotrichum gorgonifer TaxID=2041049 RepID=A0AAE8T004_9PEZI|nr:related to raffinose invertase [Cephalotrichum gorgonifer]
MSPNEVPTPPPEGGAYSRPSPAQAAADAIPLLVEDTYHVFHLTTPPFTRHHPERLRSVWSRMRSTDLVEWHRDLEPSIKPSEDKTAPDADGAWTGAAVLGPDGRMNIFYTGYNLSDGGKQVILRATSGGKHGDSGFESPRTEIKFNGDGRLQLEDIDFRDPYIFFSESESRYWMIIASRLREGPYWSRGCIALLTSKDLDTWTFEPTPLYSPNDMFCPECPELFPLPNGKWYLVYSRFHAPDSGTVYRVADSPYGPFRVPRDGSNGRLDGRRWYAAKSCPKAGDPSKRVYFGWAGDFVDEEGKWLWGGDLGVPREVSADAEGHLRISVVAEVEDLFRKTSTPLLRDAVSPGLHLSSVGSAQMRFIDDVPADQDLLVKFGIAHCDAHSFGLVLQADETQKGYRLQFTPTTPGATHTVKLLTDFAPLDDFWADQYGLHLPRSVDGPELVRHDNVDLQRGVTMFIRGRVVEVFCGGRSITYRLPLPSQKASDVASQNAIDKAHRIGWFVNDGEVRLKDFSIAAGGQISRMRV